MHCTLCHRGFPIAHPAPPRLQLQCNNPYWKLCSYSSSYPEKPFYHFQNFPRRAVFEKKHSKVRFSKQSYSISQIYYWICSIAVFVIFQNSILHFAEQILDWNKSNSKFDKYYRTVLSTLRLNVFIKNCPSREIFEIVEWFFWVRT